jgi:hypothetical protein
MGHRQLSDEEREKLFAPLLRHVRERLNVLSGGDSSLLFALRRKLAKELTYDERSRPADRRKLKHRKYREQGGKCAVCHREMTEQYSELDRFQAPLGYTAENMRLLCHDCHIEEQRSKRYDTLHDSRSCVDVVSRADCCS